ncbi:hypothetical protein HDU93_009002 [Gonapodya sp. JEL0774]|nr:hypothetical protein HDU93_009002 [Gonapodya sp. JEL0774]
MGVIYAEDTVNGQIVDRNPDLTETFIQWLPEFPKSAMQMEVKELAKLWGEGWTDKKKEQATKLIIAEGTFPEHTTPAEVIAQFARLLERTPQGATSGKGKEKAQVKSSASANLPPTDLNPEDSDLTVELEKDDNPKGALKSSKEETDATPRQKKQCESRKLINPPALPTTHLVEPDQLEAVLTAFATEQGANHLVLTIVFPNPEDSDKSRLGLKQGGQIDMSEFAAMTSNYLTAGAPTSATVCFALQSVPTSKATFLTTTPFPDLNIVKYMVLSQSKKGEKNRISHGKLHVHFEGILSPYTWVLNIKFHTNIEKHFLAIDGLLRDNAGKTLEKLIQENDFLWYTPIA